LLEAVPVPATNRRFEPVQVWEKVLGLVPLEASTLDKSKAIAKLIIGKS
jgi:hypothetical protein